MNLFELYTKDKDCIISCDTYQLKENEVVSDDGSSIVCKDCGEVRRVKVYSSLYKRDIWTAANPDETCLCSCDRKKAFEKAKEEEEIVFKRIYNGEKFRSWVGEKYIDTDLESLNLVEDKGYSLAYRACRKFLANAEDAVDKGKGIYLFSRNAGTGKSTLMAGVRNGLIAKRIKCVFINIKDLLNEASQRDVTRDTKSLYDYGMFLRIPVLILDDIGVVRLDDGRYGQWVNDTLYELMERRCRNRLSTCFTSNYSPKQLNSERGIDFKTVDRIMELATMTIDVGGLSLRGWENKNKQTDAGKEKQ